MLMGAIFELFNLINSGVTGVTLYCLESLFLKCDLSLEG